jgi:hypothetical protein
MEKYERSEQVQKIFDGLDKIYFKLKEFKKKMNSDTVVIKEGKIVKLKPDEL